MKKWITCLVATGLLATTAFVTTAADNVTITLGTNTTASTFNVLDNASTVLLNVTAGDNQTMIKKLRVEDNISAIGGIRGKGSGVILRSGTTYRYNGSDNTTLLNNTVELNEDNISVFQGASPIIVLDNSVDSIILPSPTGSGAIYTIYNDSGGDISVAGGTLTLANGKKADCIDIGVSYKCILLN